jgi:hypothetical protein
MSRQRRCDARCHTAKGDHCLCFCGGFSHGSVGAANRVALQQGAVNIEEHGFEKGTTVYLEQTKLPIEEVKGGNS